jgi:Zn-finger nucleic acid-binding protein
MPRCPKCRTRTDLIKYEGVPVYNCGGCGGHWVMPARLDLILSRRELKMPDAVKQKMIALADASNSSERLWCITCGREMVKESFKHWSEIQIDRCPGCQGIWLDRGELEKCQIYWEYLQDHPDGQDAARAERMAELETRLEERRAELRDIRDSARQPAWLRRPRYGGWLIELFTRG